MTSPAKVARVRQRTHDRQELPPSVWRRQLRQLAKWLLIAYALVFYVMLMGVLFHA